MFTAQNLKACYGSFKNAKLALNLKARSWAALAEKANARQITKVIRFESGQIVETPYGPLKVIREPRSMFIRLCKGRKQVLSTLVQIVHRQEIFTLEDGSVVRAR